MLIDLKSRNYSRIFKQTCHDFLLLVFHFQSKSQLKTQNIVYPTTYIVILVVVYNVIKIRRLKTNTNISTFIFLYTAQFDQVGQEVADGWLYRSYPFVRTMLYLTLPRNSHNSFLTIFVTCGVLNLNLETKSPNLH